MYSTNSNQISETDILRTMTGSNPSQSAVIYGTRKWGNNGSTKRKKQKHDNPYIDYYNSEKKKKDNSVKKEGTI